ncbi:MAG: HAD family phosphatase [Anaerolineae bacterium]|nr:HAD family phosphatase [Anaerolineae bacterium]MBT7990970.1 HAD family phosphatase [Anaerolineae bacterium]
MIDFKKIKGVLWDMDGVLADTNELHNQAMVSALASHQIDFPREVYLKTVGTNIRNILTVTLGEPPNEDFVQKIVTAQGTSFCKLIKGQLHPLPGILELLAYFQEHGTAQAIASSSADFVIQAVLDEIGVREYFGVIVSGSQLSPKPSPEIFLHTASTLKIPAVNCVVIEDSPHGIQGANAAKMQSIAITTSYKRDAFGEADMVVDDFAELFDVLY